MVTGERKIQMNVSSVEKGKERMMMHSNTFSYVRNQRGPRYELYDIIDM
jgi:hypothetical protein